MAELCGSQGFAGSSACIAERGHDGEHRYGNFKQALEAEIRQDARRYRWLRERDVNAIDSGGLFVGLTPNNVVLNGDDLDIEIDRRMSNE